VAVVVSHLVEGIEMPRGWVAGLGTRDVEADDALVTEPDGQLGDLQRPDGVADLRRDGTDRRSWYPHERRCPGGPHRRWHRPQSSYRIGDGGAAIVVRIGTWKAGSHIPARIDGKPQDEPPRCESDRGRAASYPTSLYRSRS
jgi:hypothetical protein